MLNNSLTRVLDALAGSFRTMLWPRIWGYLVLPILVVCALGFFLVIWFFGELFTLMIDVPPFSWLVSVSFMGIGSMLAQILIFLFFVVFLFVIATVITGIWLAPILAEVIRKKHYSDLAMLGDDSLLAGLGTTVSSLLLFGVLWVITLPLWFLPVIGQLVPFVLIAWLNRRLYTLDVLVNVARVDEIEMIRKQHSGALMMLGFVYALLVMVPPVNLILAPLTALGYIHFCLQALSELRQAQPMRLPESKLNITLPD